MFLNLVQVFEILENTIFKDGMEFFLNRCQKRCCLKRINALLTEGLFPVECLQVVHVEAVKHMQNASDNLAFIHCVVS